MCRQRAREFQSDGKQVLSSFDSRVPAMSSSAPSALSQREEEEEEPQGWGWFRSALSADHERGAQADVPLPTWQHGWLATCGSTRRLAAGEPGLSPV